MLDFTLVEGPTLMTDPSVEKVRRMHKDWLVYASEEERGGPLPEYWLRKLGNDRRDQVQGYHDFTDGPSDFPRYSCCIYIDSDAYNSILAALENPELIPQAYVLLVRTYWVPFLAPSYPPHPDDDQEEDSYDREDEGECPVDGCRLRDVGYMKYRIDALPHLSEQLHADFSHWWSLLYTRPPAIGSMETELYVHENGRRKTIPYDFVTMSRKWVEKDDNN